MSRALVARTTSIASSSVSPATKRRAMERRTGLWDASVRRRDSCESRIRTGRSMTSTSRRVHLPVSPYRESGHSDCMALLRLVDYRHRRVVVAGPSAGQPDAGVDHTVVVATRGDHHGIMHEPYETHVSRQHML